MNEATTIGDRMNNVAKKMLLKVLPPSMYGPLYTVYTNCAWRADPRAVKSRTKLRELHDLHKGERCFIIGNGPSLNKMDLSPLSNEITFGLNRIYLLFDQIGFSTTYYVSVNGLVILQCAKEIESINSTKFINWNCRRSFSQTADVYYINDPRGGSKLEFSRNPMRRTYFDSTVTFAAMQLAFWFGFKKVILIGVDHNFSTKGENDKEVVSTGSDPNHFHPEYFGKGFRWQLPNLARSERAYNLAKLEFEKDGREVVDATVGGKLNVFRKVHYEDLF